MKNDLGNLKDITSDEFRRDAKVLGPNETRRDILWKTCVAEAKSLMKMTQEVRLKIVDLAFKCCVIHHGGRYANERYTVTRFAKEVGMHHRTLLDWMRMKKQISDMLPEKDRAGLTLTQMKFIDSKLAGTNREASKVLKIHKQMQKLDPSTIKMQKYVKHLKSIKFNVANPVMIKNCDEEILVEMLHLAREIVNCLKHIDVQTKIRKAT